MLTAASWLARGSHVMEEKRSLVGLTEDMRLHSVLIAKLRETARESLRLIAQYSSGRRQPAA
jgi:hypothetical protein